MRNLFIVLAKVVGLLQIPTALKYLYYLNLYFSEILRKNDGWAEFQKNYMYIAENCVSMGLILVLCWVLLFRTNRIADRLGVPEGGLTLPDSETLFCLGIKLLGIYVLIESIPNLISVVVSTRTFNPDTRVSYFGARILPAVLKLTFGLLLVFKTTKVIGLISRDAKPKEIVSV